MQPGQLKPALWKMKSSYQSERAKAWCGKKHMNIGNTGGKQKSRGGIYLQYKRGFSYLGGGKTIELHFTSISNRTLHIAANPN